MGVQYYSSETDIAKHIYFKKDDFLQPLGEFHGSVEMIFMLEGVAEAHLNDKTYELRPGDIFFADSYEGHWYRHKTSSVLAYVLVLSREYLRDFYDLYSGQTLLTYMSNHEKNEKIFALVEEWYNESEKTHIKDLGYSRLLEWEGGRKNLQCNLERPSLLFDEKGNPAYLFCASGNGSAPYQFEGKTYVVCIGLSSRGDFDL